MISYDHLKIYLERSTPWWRDVARYLGMYGFLTGGDKISDVIECAWVPRSLGRAPTQMKYPHRCSKSLSWPSTAEYRMMKLKKKKMLKVMLKVTTVRVRVRISLHSPEICARPHSQEPVWNSPYPNNQRLGVTMYRPVAFPCLNNSDIFLFLRCFHPSFLPMVVHSTLISVFHLLHSLKR